MKKNTKYLEPILVAAPQELADLLAQVLEERGFSVLVAPSLNDALSSIEVQEFQAVVMISDWAITLDQPSKLMEAVKGKIPSVVLINSHTWQHYKDKWFNEIFHPPLHEYCFLPLVVKELVMRIDTAMQAPKTSKNLP